MKFFASLMGVEVGTEGDEKEEKQQPSASKKSFVPRADMNSTLFKHPREYARLSEAEKQELSERMLGVHQQAMRNSPLGRGIF